MKPFLAGRPSLQGAALRPAQEAGESPALPPLAGTAGARHAAHGTSAASVECVKQGDKVVRLVVTCSCGEKIEIECLYPAGG
jgi:hypothetical protein